MRLAAFLIVLAVALGAVLVLRPPSKDAGGVAPDAPMAATGETPRAPVDLARGERTSAASLPSAAPVAPNSAPAQPRPAPGPKAPDASGKGASKSPVPDNGIAAVPASIQDLPDDSDYAQKYDQTSPEQRRQAMESIYQLFEQSPNLDPREVGLLKQEIEWLQRSLDS